MTEGWWLPVFCSVHLIYYKLSILVVVQTEHSSELYMEMD